MPQTQCPCCDREEGRLLGNYRVCYRCHIRWSKTRRGYSVHEPGVRYMSRNPPLWMAMNRHFGLCWCGRPIEGEPPGFCGNGAHEKVWDSATAWWREFRKIIAYADKACRMCGKPVLTYGYCDSMHVIDSTVADHIVPIKLGGWCYDEGNVQTLCRNCNIEKTKNDLSEIYYSTHGRKPDKDALGKDALDPCQTTLDILT